MKKVSIITAEEAAMKVQDGDTIATGGFVSCACPEALSTALEKRFLETGHPKDLTLFFAAGQGHRDGTGGDHYGHEGMVKRVIGGHWDRAPKLGDLALAIRSKHTTCPRALSPTCTVISLLIISERLPTWAFTPSWIPETAAENSMSAPRKIW